MKYNLALIIISYGCHNQETLANEKMSFKSNTQTLSL